MVTVVLREIVIALAFFAMPFWALGIHWNAFAAGAVLVGVEVYIGAQKRARAREVSGADRSERYLRYY